MATNSEKGLVLVDGAAGYVGKRVVLEFIQKGYKVRATDLPSSDLQHVKNLGAEVITSDLLDTESLKKIVKDVDYVVHCAALFSLTANIDILRKVNVLGTKNLLEASNNASVKHFIHVSSSDIYGVLKTLPGNENHPQHPTNDYAITKKESEEIVIKYSKEHGMPYSIIRPSAIYGPGSVYIAGVFFFWPIFLKFLKIPFIPYISGGSKLTFAHVDDIAGSIEFLTGKKEAFGEAYNIADEDFTYSAKFACHLLEAFKIKNMLPFSIFLPHIIVDFYGKLALYTSGWFLKLINPWVKKRWEKLRKKFELDPVFTPHFERQFYCYFIGHRYFSSKKIQDLGYTFRNKSFEQGFSTTFQWYVTNKWLPPIKSLGKKIKNLKIVDSII